MMSTNELSGGACRTSLAIKGHPTRQQGIIRRQMTITHSSAGLESLAPHTYTTPFHTLLTISHPFSLP